MTIYGVDYLGGKNYQKAMLQTHPSGWAGGIFLRTFGDARGTVEAVCKSGKFSELVVHLARFENSHAYQINKHLSQLKKDSVWLETIGKRYPNTKLLLSPFCEHKHSKEKMGSLLKELSSLAPSTTPLNSIYRLQFQQCIPGVITEFHLETSKDKKIPSGEFFVSFDGFGGKGQGDFTDTNIEDLLHFYHQALQIRLWNFRYNGKFGHGDEAPVDKRKNWPSPEYMLGHNAMMKEREGEVTWKKDRLLKPFADDHGIGGKDNKLMCILPIKKNSVDVFDKNGKKIATMKIPPPPLNPEHKGVPKGRRFYSDKYAYQIGDLAEKSSGSRLIRIENEPLTDADLRSNLFK